MSIFGLLFFPVRAIFRGKSGGRTTVAEQRRNDSGKIKEIAGRIEEMHGKVVKLEREIPYERNDKKRRNMDIEKLRVEKQITELERKHHDLSGRIKG